MQTVRCRSIRFLLLLAVAEAGSFWVVTDWHINNWFQADPPLQNASEASVLGLCHAPTNQTGLRPGRWSSFGCSSNLNLWEASLDFMKKTEPAPDFVLWLGDNYGHVVHDSEDLVLASTNLLGQLIKEHFPGVPVIAAVGNHDTWPYNSDPGPEFYAKLTAAWGIDLDQTQLQTANQAGYYATRVSSLVILSVNTQHLSDTVLQWVRLQLEQATRAGDKVLIGAHIPAGPASCYNCTCSNGYEGDCWSTGWQAQFVSILLQHSRTVVGVVSGHTHSDEFRVLQNSNGSVPMFIVPSLPPYNPSTNPAVRQFITAHEHQIIDYQQWTMDLAASNLVDEPKWSAYSPLQLYQLDSLSPQALTELYERFWQDDDLFQVYYQAFSSFPSIPTSCTNAWSPSVYSPHGGGGRCKAGLLCPIMMGTDESAYFACLSSHNSSA